MAASNTAKHEAESPVAALWRWTIPAWLVLLIVLVVLAIVVWGVLGLRTTGLFEDWDIFNGFDKSVSLADLFFFGQSTRPLLLLPYWIGHSLTPGSFVGVNGVEIALFFAKSLLLYAVLRKLRPDARLFALTAALLFALYPADTGWFITRYLSQVSTVVLYLLAVYLLLLYWSSRRWGILIASLVALALALGIYEAIYPLALVTPVLLLWRERRLSRRVIAVSVAWYVTILLMIGFVLYLTSQTEAAYQESLLGNADQLPLLERLGVYARATLIAIWRALGGGWLDALRNLRIDMPTAWLSAFAAVVTAAAVLLFSRFAPLSIPIGDAAADGKVRWQRLIARLGLDPLWFAVGLVIIVFGFALFVPLPTHRVLTERVYMLASVGGAISVAAAIHWLAHRVKRPAWVIAPALGILIGIALGGMLPHLLVAKTISIEQQIILSQIVQQAPHVADDTLIVIDDQTHQLSSAQYLFAIVGSSGQYLEAAVDVVYQQPSLGVVVCDPEAFLAATLVKPCAFDADGITPAQARYNVQARKYPSDHVLVFDYLGESRLQLRDQWVVAGGEGYNPAALIESTAPPPPRVYSLFEQYPVVDQTPYNQRPQASLDLNFAAKPRLFLDNPIYPFAGYGWQSDAGIWMTALRSTIDTWLTPDHSYDLQIHAVYALQPESFDQLALQVNGQPVTLQTLPDPQGGRLYTAILPASVVALDPARTRLLFTLPSITSPAGLGINGDTRFLGIRFDWLRISPVAES